jgi:uncharacterized lipoprotein YmbA
MTVHFSMPNPLRSIVPVLAAVLLAACGTVPSDHFYTLIGNASPAAPGARESGPGVAIISVTLPEAVDRSEIVLRSGANRVIVMDTQRWAESLKSAIPRTIAGDLSPLLGGATVSVQSDNASRDAAYTVWVDITRFDSTLGEAAVIDANWGVRASVGGPSKSGKGSWRVPAHGGGFEDLVAAHAAALAQLSAEIAIQIKDLEKVGN